MKIKLYLGLMVAALILTTAAVTHVARGQGGEVPAPEAAIPAEEAALGGCKIAFVNLARVLEESGEGKKMKEKLEAERSKALQVLKPEHEKLEQIEEQMSVLRNEIVTKGQVWDDYTRATKQNELNTLGMSYNSLLDKIRIEKAKIQQELNKKNAEMLQPLEDKLNAIMQEVGKKGGYCLVLDVSPPSSNLPNLSNIIFYDVNLDITEQVIAAVDKE